MKFLYMLWNSRGSTERASTQITFIWQEWRVFWSLMRAISTHRRKPLITMFTLKFTSKMNIFYMGFNAALEFILQRTYRAFIHAIWRLQGTILAFKFHHHFFSELFTIICIVILAAPLGDWRSSSVFLLCLYRYTWINTCTNKIVTLAGKRSFV